MKKNLLFLFSLCISIMGSSQTLIDKTDTVYSASGMSGTTYGLQSTIQNTYDSVCRLHTSTYIYFDPATNQPVSSGRYIYDYNPDGSRFRFIYQTSTAVPGAFTDNHRVTYSYVAPGLQGTQTWEIWNGSAWVPSQLVTFDYTQFGDETSELLQFWNSKKNAYVNYHQYMYDYDENGNQTLYSYQLWDTTGNRWITDYEYDRTYDDNSYQTSETAKSHNNKTDSLDLVSYTSYYIIAGGYPDSTYTFNYRDSSFQTSRTIYYPNSNQYQYRYLYNSNASGSFFYSTRYTHVLDSSAYWHLDSTAIETKDMFRSDYLLGLIVYTRNTYDADSTVTTSEAGSDFYNNGIFLRRSSTKIIHHNEPCSSVLPVTLLSFTGNKKDNNAILQWKTANETNTASFAVQRSIDGIHFITIGLVKASGNGGNETKYSYTDANIDQYKVKRLYYRLAQQDIDGAVRNSPVVQVEIAKTSITVALSPNPARNTIYVYTPTSMSDVVIHINNMTGAVLYTSRTSLTAGSRFSIDISSLAKGMYFVTLQSSGNSHVYKIIKE